MSMMIYHIIMLWLIGNEIVLLASLPPTPNRN